MLETRREGNYDDSSLQQIIKKVETGLLENRKKFGVSKDEWFSCFKK